MDTEFIIFLAVLGVTSFLLGFFSKDIRHKLGLDVKMRAPVNFLVVIIAALLAFGDD